MESVALALPVLLALMALEYIISKRRGKKYFSFSDSISNLSIGVLDRITGLLFAGFFYFIYEYLQIHFGILEIRPSVISWALMFFLVDFLWYWYHRYSHEVNIFWAEHVVHHSSKEFNYVVGVRVTIFQSFVRLLFWCLLPIIGFTAPMIVLMLLIHGVYSFFTHTRIIGKLGFLEYFIVTPSHHRVHHASNETYLDKNYGGVLIIWDRLFGTFAEEKEAVAFGLTKPLRSQSLLWQLFHFWVELYYMVKLQKGLRNKLKILFGKPELMDPTLRDELELRFLAPKAKGRISNLFKRYIVLQISFSILALIILLYFSSGLSVWIIWAISSVIVLTLINCGAIMEQRKWVFHLEYARYLLLTAYISYDQPALIIPGVILLTLSLVYFSSLKRYYFSFYFNT